MSRPLQGFKIAEMASKACPLALRLSIGLAGRIAADLGADVILVEPPEGDALRRVSGDGGGLFAFLSAGKRSLVAPSENGVLERFLGGVHGLIADGGLAGSLVSATGGQLPSGASRAAALLSMLGEDAPGDAPQSEFTILALGGLLDIVGEPERQPLRLGGHQAAYSTGLAAYTGLAAALCVTPDDRQPQVEIVRASMLETVVWLNWKNLVSAGWSGKAPSRSGSSAEWQVVACADGWVALVYEDHNWPALCTLAGDPRLEAPEYADRDGRKKHARAIAEIFTERFAHLTRRQIQAAAIERRLPLGPVWSPAELVSDPHSVARGFLTTAALPDGGSFVTPRLPVLWNAESFAPGPVPAIGPSMAVAA